LPTTSTLLRAFRTGCLPQPISARTALTESICFKASPLDASMTWMSRSAFTVSSRVALKDATSWWGRFLTNPTVSLSRTSTPLAGVHFLVRVSRVEKSRSSTSTPASVRVFKRVLFPALVYPTRQILKSPLRPSISRILRLSISASWCFSSVIFFVTSLLSISSCCSPVPLVPMAPTVPAAVAPPAPATESRCDHIRVNLGYMYSSWARSTCNWACLVFALAAKMSKISSLLSKTLVCVISSRSRIWAGERLLSKIITSALNLLTLRASSSTLPFPR